MTVSYGISGGDNYILALGTGGFDPLIEFPAIIGNVDFDFTVALSESGGTITSTSVLSAPPFVNTTVLGPSSVLVERDLSSSLFDEDYTFIVYSDDYSTSNTFNLDLESFYSYEDKQELNIISWNIPADTSITGTFSFLVSYLDEFNDPQTSTGTFTQDFYWDGTVGIPIFRGIIANTTYQYSESEVNNAFESANLEFSANSIDLDSNLFVYDTNTVIEQLEEFGMDSNTYIQIVNG